MNWKKLLLVALVVTLVVIGLPMLMPGMGGGSTCADCGPAVSAQSACELAAILAGLLLVIALVAERLRLRRDELRLLLRAVLLDRPPQLV